jgi:Holliday junction resolvase-like predicted endonuclease
MLGTRRQGDLGEASALQWLLCQEAHVFVSFGHSPNCDLVAELDGCLLRIQVKTSCCRSGSGYAVSLATRGGNRSWSGVAKLFDTSRFDYVFVLVADGRRWLIPACEIMAKHSIVVGGRSWARFEVEPGLPIRDADEHAGARPLESIR